MEKISNLYYFFTNTLIFILIIPIGVLTHELGHYIFAKLLNLNPIFHFTHIEFDLINQNCISNTSELITIIAGPLITMIFATCGIVGLLIFNKNKYLYVYLTLFASREIFNLLAAFLMFIQNKRNELFGGDEYYINEYLKLPNGIIPIFMAIIAILYIYFAVFIKIKETRRLNFMFSGLVGGIFGYFFWLHFI